MFAWLSVSTAAAFFGARMKTFGVGGMLGVAGFAATVLLFQFAPGTATDWTRHYLSDFANGPVGWLFSVGLFGNAVGNAFIGLGLYAALPRGAARIAATTLFLCASGGLALASIFDTDPAGAAVTASGVVHRAAVSAAFAVGLIALALFSEAFASRPDRRLAARISTGLTSLAAAGCLAMLTALAFGWRPGLVERMAVAPFLAWEFWAAAHVFRHGGNTLGHMRRKA